MTTARILWVMLWMFLPASLWAGSELSGHPAKVELVSEVTSVQPGSTFQTALHFRIQPHWHIYWKNPGDSGIPPAITWTLPEGVTAGEFAWPTPERIEVPPLVNYGYSNEAYLMMPITVPSTWKVGTALPLKAKVSWLVCKEICIPGKAEVTLEVTVGEKHSFEPNLHKAFEATRQKLPGANSPYPVKLSVNDTKVIFRVEHAFPSLSRAVFFPAEAGKFENASDQEWLVDTHEARLTLTRDTQIPSKLDQVKGVLVFFTDKNKSGEAYWVDVSADDKPQAASPKNSEVTTMNAVHPVLWQMIAFAFLGGLILNLMPCVLPILSIKILGFVEQAGKSKDHLRQHGWAFFFGVMVSFWTLAGALLILRAGGEKLGWGFQLQSPLFLLALITLLFFMAMSFLGVFEVGESLGGVGGKLASKSGYAGSFFSGVLATIVATPCTAPFMGSAVGFALTEPPTSAILIFTSLGMGMAFPYLALSYAPQLLRFLPRPGRWMETLKQFMAFPLFATVIWLIWVFGFQTGMDGVLRVLMGLLFFAVAAWLYGRNKHSTGNKHRLAYGAAVLALISGGYLGVAGAKQAAPCTLGRNSATDGMQWEPYSAARLKELHDKGTPVFLDFTAAWCVSCQVNEKVVFSSEEVRNQFKALGIVGMKADWTNGDSAITDILASFGRSGVPFYLLYGKDPKAQPKQLPEVLSPGIVLDAIKSL